MKIKAGIAGAAGFTGGEMIRILSRHPDVDLVFAHSSSQAGKRLSDVHGGLWDMPEMCFTDTLQNDIDVLFLCLGHGESAAFLKANVIPAGVKLIDLSQDFRYQNGTESADWVYGLPELNRERIQRASRIANPGCFATAIQLALLPLAAERMLQDEIHVSAITGSTGAGRSHSDTTHFSWRDSNVSAYKALDHQHVREIRNSLIQLNGSYSAPLFFVPYRGNFTRGIFATAYTRIEGPLDRVRDLYADYYSTHPFVRVLDQELDLKMSVNTNYCLLHLSRQGNMLILNSALDNLLKGACGQAVQNMNLLFGLPEQQGLNFKASAF